MLIPLLIVVNCHLIPASDDTQFVKEKTVQVGTCQDDELAIEGGVSFVNARGGKDVIIDKSADSTRFQGGSGNDVFYSGPGNDVYYGGLGYDLYIFDGPFGTDQIVDMAFVGPDKLIFMNYVVGSLTEDLIRNQLTRREGEHLIIDLTGVIGFGGSKLYLLIMSDSRFKNLSIEVRLSR